MRSNPLEGQAALVTGANSGIGEGVARCFAAAGARVAINYVTHPEAAEKIVSDIKRDGGEAIAIEADVSNENEVKAMYSAMFKPSAPSTFCARMPASRTIRHSSKCRWRNGIT